jgi:hypothetical protein
MARAIAETLYKDVIALEKRCERLERELEELKGHELSRRLKAVPPSPPDAMIA